jgi:hypothetical protein
MDSRLILMMAFGAALNGDTGRSVPTTTILDDPQVIFAMSKAWTQSGNGTTGKEASFRIDASPSGIRVVSLPFTNEFKKHRVKLIRGVTFLIFHVHPGGDNPAPSKIDKEIADRHQVRIVTMHVGGLYEYDPITGKTTKLRNKLDWIKARADLRPKASE